MSERVESVRFIANMTNYLAGLEKAQIATEKLSATSASRMQKTRDAYERTGRTLLTVGTIAEASVFLAVRAFTQFDKAMSQVQSVSGATTGELDNLAHSAIEVGRRFGYSAVQAASAEEALSKAGVSVKDIIGGALGGALTLAAAGQYDVADSADLAAIAMKEFGLQGSQVPHVADLIAAAAGKAVGDVSDIADALKQSGLVASQFGLSIEDTTGTLAAFSDAGLIGSDSGTSFKQMLLSLASPSGKAKKALDDLHLSAFDTQGQFIGITQLAGQLQDKLGGLTQAQRLNTLSLVFGQDAIRSATVLYNEGADGIQGYIDQTNDAGYAAKQAAARLDNLSGDLGKLNSAFTKDLIESGSGANDILRGTVQSVTQLLDVIGDVPTPVLAVALALTGAAGAVTLAGGAALIAVPKYLALKVAMADAGISGKRMAAGIGIASGALTIATVAVGFFLAIQAQASAASSDFADSLDKTSGALTSYSRDLVIKQLQENNAFGTAKKAGISQKELTDAVLEGGDALDKVKKKLTSFGQDNSFGPLGYDAYSAGIAIDQAATAVQDGTQKWKDSAAANKDAEAATKDNSQALDEMQGSATNANTAIKDLADTIRGFGSAALSTRDAERDFQAAIDDAQASLKEHGKTLDINTEAGRGNQQTLDQIAKSALAAAAARYEETGSQKDATDAIQSGRDALIGQLAQYGIVGQAAQQYADNLGLIPKNVDTLVNLNTDPAQTALNNYLHANNQHYITVGIKGGNIATSRASGGILPGSPSRRDNMLIAAASGEFVVRATATAVPSNRRALDYINNGGVIDGFANGGQVGASGYQYVGGAGGDGGLTVQLVLPMTNSFVGERTEFARHVTRVVQEALQGGKIPTEWYRRR
jgi:TP901 family phage tail tape measure protein